MKCLVCETETSNPKYCSLKCAGVASWLGRPRKNKTKQCVECQKEFQYRELQQRFCSRSCAAKHNNRGVARNISVSVAKGVRLCSYCNAGIISKNATKYCSAKCMGMATRQRSIDAWLSDSSTATVEQGLKQSIRTYLIEQANYQCSQCGWGEVNPTSGKVPLEVDHIDGDCYNNSSENLRVLCPNCHSLTPTYRALNKSKRSYRKTKD